MPNTIWSRDKLNSGNPSDGSFVADDNVASNNDSGGFLRNFSISNIGTTILTRNAWLKTMFYQIAKGYAHLVENKALAADLGTTVESTSDKLVASDQLPNTLVVQNDLTVTTVPADGTVSSTQDIFNLAVDVTGKNRVLSLGLKDVFIKFLLRRILPAGGANKYVISKTSATDFDYAWVDVNTLLPSITANKALYVNAANPNNGDGSVLNPFQTIDLLWTYIDTNSLYGLGYTITVSGGAYSTSNNLSNGNTWEFKTGATITYTGTNYLFYVDATNVKTFYNVIIRGYLNFVSSTGGFVKGYGGGGQLLDIQINNITHTASTGSGVILVNGQVDNTIMFNKISVASITAIQVGDIASGFLARLNANGNQIVAPICVDVQAGVLGVNFKNINFVSGTKIFKLTGMSSGGLTILNCPFSLIASNTKPFDVYDAFAGVLNINNVRMIYGSSTTASTITLFTANAISSAKTINSLNLVMNSSMVLNSDNTKFTQQYVGVSGGTSNVPLAPAVISYAYGSDQ